MAEYFGSDVFKLGFGLMRLPRTEDGKHVDIPQFKQMVDMFIAAGGTYFDTAYVYGNGESERATKEALVDRYPRESYTLCTKLNVRAQGVYDETSAKAQFYTSLDRTGAGYFDYYLLHALMPGNYKLYDEYHIWDFAKELKERGLIKHYGFSFHGTTEMLEELLTDHPDVDFIQLQINYLDLDNPSVESQKCYDIARAHGKSFTVMEPVKGGALANPMDEVKKLFTDYAPDMSPASWAIRYCASLDGVITVLSGMSNVEQMADNLSYMKDFKPLCAEEYEVIEKVREAFRTVKAIGCTGCSYCTDGCPMQIPIPKIFSARNRMYQFNDLRRGREAYKYAIKDAGSASDCVECGQCEGACPQALPIIKLLAECAEVFGQD